MTNNLLRITYFILFFVLIFSSTIDIAYSLDTNSVLSDAGNTLHSLLDNSSSLFFLTFILLFILFFAIFLAGLSRVHVFASESSLGVTRQGKVLAVVLALLADIGIIGFSYVSGEPLATVNEVLKTFGWFGAVALSIISFLLVYLNLKGRFQTGIALLAAGISLVTYSILLDNSSILAIGILLIVLGIIFILVSAFGSDDSSEVSLSPQRSTQTSQPGQNSQSRQEDSSRSNNRGQNQPQPQNTSSGSNEETPPNYTSQLTNLSDEMRNYDYLLGEYMLHGNNILDINHNYRNPVGSPPRPTPPVDASQWQELHNHLRDLRQNAGQINSLYNGITSDSSFSQIPQGQLEQLLRYARQWNDLQQRQESYRLDFRSRFTSGRSSA